MIGRRTMPPSNSGTRGATPTGTATKYFLPVARLYKALPPDNSHLSSETGKLLAA